MEKKPERKPEGKPVFRHDWHWMIWDYIWKHPGVDKSDAVKALGLQDFVVEEELAKEFSEDYEDFSDDIHAAPGNICFTNNCPACHATEKLILSNGLSPIVDCDFCPLDWGEDGATCVYASTKEYGSGLYELWGDVSHRIWLSRKFGREPRESDLKEHSKLARKIRDTKLKDEAWSRYKVISLKGTV